MDIDILHSQSLTSAKSLYTLRLELDMLLTYRLTYVQLAWKLVLLYSMSIGMLNGLCLPFPCLEDKKGKIPKRSFRMFNISLVFTLVALVTLGLSNVLY